VCAHALEHAEVQVMRLAVLEGVEDIWGLLLFCACAQVHVCTEA